MNCWRCCAATATYIAELLACALTFHCIIIFMQRNGIFYTVYKVFDDFIAKVGNYGSELNENPFAMWLKRMALVIYTESDEQNHHSNINYQSDCYYSSIAAEYEPFFFHHPTVKLNRIILSFWNIWTTFTLGKLRQTKALVDFSVSSVDVIFRRHTDSFRRLVVASILTEMEQLPAHFDYFFRMCFYSLWGAFACVCVSLSLSERMKN